MQRPILLCLHGWGGSKESFAELRAALHGSDVDILTPDLPGFGDEPEPTKPWTTDDYVDWVVQWFRVSGYGLRGRKIFLLGHSHGGRIAIKLAARLNPATRNSQLATITIDHLFLCAPAGIRHQRHFKRIIGLTLAKAGKGLLSIPGLKQLQPLGKKFLYQLIRVHDYEKASPVMRETLIKVSAEDLTPLLSRVNVPTDIFWGTDDGMTPISDSEVMRRLISGSVLHTYPGVRHAVHRDSLALKDITKCIKKAMESA